MICPEHKGRKKSIRVDSFVEKSHLFLAQCIAIAYIWSHEFTVKMAAEMSGLSLRVVVDWNKSPSILAFFRLGLGREMEPTNQPQKMCMPRRREPPSTFSVVLRGRHRPPNSPGHRRPRPRGSPRHDLHRVSPLQRCSEYSKAFAVHGPKILL